MASLFSGMLVHGNVPDYLLMSRPASASISKSRNANLTDSNNYRGNIYRIITGNFHYDQDIGLNLFVQIQSNIEGHYENSQLLYYL